jgi:hypothetical protein
MLLARARELECVLHDAVDALARKYRLLRDHFSGSIFEHAAADVPVFALGVLADDDVVDVAGLAAGERAGQAFEQAHRSQVDVKVEPAAEVDEQPPGRDVIGNDGRIACGAEIDGIELAQDVGRVVGAHLAVRLVPVAAPREFLPLEAQPVLRRHGLEHAHAFRDHFAADAVAGDHRNRMFFHVPQYIESPHALRGDRDFHRVVLGRAVERRRDRGDRAARRQSSLRARAPDAGNPFHKFGNHGIES